MCSISLCHDQVLLFSFMTNQGVTSYQIFSTGDNMKSSTWALSLLVCPSSPYFLFVVFFRFVYGEGVFMLLKLFVFCFIYGEGVLMLLKL